MLKPEQNNRPSLFLPFDGLAGWRDKVRQRERIIVKKRELGEDDLSMLDRKIHFIEPYMIVEITYYDKDCYVKKTGMLARIDYNKRVLQVVKDEVCMDDIVDIQCELFDDSFF